MKTADLARGKWRGILSSFGIDTKFLSGKHGPCPFCEGSDRFRWDNKDGKGTFFCSQCGSGDGFEFIKRAKGWDFRTAAKEVEAVMGHIREEPTKPQIDERSRAEMLNNLWRGGSILTLDDMAGAYLAGRGVLPGRVPSCLRFHPNCPVPAGGGFLPAMIALVQDADGEGVNIHRTFLGPNGKADIDSPRAVMSGKLPPGSAIRLYPVHGERLGIAEGIETAIAAAKRFNMPVWAAINSTLMEQWTPPAGVTDVVVFGDNDVKFGGQAAAYALAHRLAARMRIAAEVRIPQNAGKDWADVDAA